MVLLMNLGCLCTKDQVKKLIYSCRRSEFLCHHPWDPIKLFHDHRYSLEQDTGASALTNPVLTVSKRWREPKLLWHWTQRVSFSPGLSLTVPYQTWTAWTSLSFAEVSKYHLILWGFPVRGIWRTKNLLGKFLAEMTKTMNCDPQPLVRVMMDRGTLITSATLIFLWLC